MNMYLPRATAASNLARTPSSGPAIPGVPFGQPCDFHLEISDVGESSDADRVIVEIPQGPRFIAARNKLIQIVRDSGVTLSKRIRFDQPIRVQVLGFLFFDAWHYSTTKPRGNNHGSAQVASIWEIHPVWAIIQAS